MLPHNSTMMQDPVCDKENLGQTGRGGKQSKVTFKSPQAVRTAKPLSRTPQPHNRPTTPRSATRQAVRSSPRETLKSPVPGTRLSTKRLTVPQPFNLSSSNKGTVKEPEINPVTAPQRAAPRSHPSKEHVVDDFVVDPNALDTILQHEENPTHTNPSVFTPKKSSDYRRLTALERNPKRGSIYSPAGRVLRKGGAATPQRASAAFLSPRPSHSTYLRTSFTPRSQRASTAGAPLFATPKKPSAPTSAVTTRASSPVPASSPRASSPVTQKAKSRDFRDPSVQAKLLCGLKSALQAPITPIKGNHNRPVAHGAFTPSKSPWASSKPFGTPSKTPSPNPVVVRVPSPRFEEDQSVPDPVRSVEEATIDVVDVDSVAPKQTVPTTKTPAESVLSMLKDIGISLEDEEIDSAELLDITESLLEDEISQIEKSGEECLPGRMEIVFNPVAKTLAYQNDMPEICRPIPRRVRSNP